MKTLKSKIKSLIKDYEKLKENCEKDLAIAIFKEPRLIFKDRIYQVTEFITDLKDLIKRA